MARSIKSERTRKTSRIAARLTKIGAPLLGLLSFAAPLFAANEELLNSPDRPPYQWFATTDKKHENEDYLLLKPGETRKLPLARGRIERLWWTAIKPDKIGLELFDKGSRVPLYGAWLHEKGTVFMSDSVFLQEYMSALPDSATKHISVAPKPIDVSSSAYLKVTNRSKDSEGNKFFYQVSIRPPYKSAPVQTGDVQHVSEKAELAPGEEKAIELTGAGLIQNISLSFERPQDMPALQLRAAWDGEAKDAVNAPLSTLLCLFQGGDTSSSAAFEYNGNQAELRWPMPFGEGAKIKIANIGAAPAKFSVQINSSALLAAPKYRFHAVYGSARTEKKKAVRMLHVSGPGAFCGLNLAITPAPDSGRRTFAYLEGNETITADGKKYEGTGTEDFFSSAWYFPQKPFNFPYHGMTYKTMSPPGVGAYRLMIPDALPFKKSLQFDFEHGNNYNSNDLLFRWVAFWYGAPGAQFEIADALHDNVGKAPPEGGPAHLNIFLVALVTSLIVGGGGGFIIKMARNRAQKSS